VHLTISNDDENVVAWNMTSDMQSHSTIVSRK
jgi:hypothetical protein